MKLLHKLVFVSTFILSIFIVACKKEQSIEINQTGTQLTNITATLTGRILNEFGEPVIGALVKAGGLTSLTNVNGEFRLNNTPLNKDAAFVTVEKVGYFAGSRTFRAIQGGKHYIEIQLIPKQNIGFINSSSGGTINLGDGSSISLPPNSVVFKNSGNAYTGDIKVAMTWLNPTDSKLEKKMPGDLRGINDNGDEKLLVTYGMINVELTTSTGEKLQIAANKKAIIKFPLPASLQSTATATIPLWSFNDTTGLWKQEGLATKNGNFYVAEVNHFSWWNCDIAITDAAFFNAIFLNPNGQPAENCHVRVSRVSGASGAAYGYTDSLGFITGRIPANEQLKLEVYGGSGCSNQPFYSQNIGPFTTNSTNSLGNLTLNSTIINTYRFLANVVSCNNQPVISGYIEMYDFMIGVHRAPIINGVLNMSVQSCTPNIQITYYVVDSANNQQSSPNTIITGAVGSTINLGMINACGISNSRYINFTLDGVSYFLTSPADSTKGFSNIYGQNYSNPINTTNISGFSVNPYKYIYFDFEKTQVGTFPMIRLGAFVPGQTDSLRLSSLGAAINITEFGIYNSGFIAGNFNTFLLNTTNNTTHPIQCTFRVRNR